MIEIAEINNKRIAVKGVARLFFEQGLPISISAMELERKGVTVSYLHIADELIKANWSDKAIINKLNEELVYFGIECDMDLVKHFLSLTYEASREVLFSYLFGCNWDSVRNGENKEVLEWAKKTING